MYLCVDICSVLDYFDADKGDLVINRKFHRKRQAGMEAIKSGEKINCSTGAGHSDQGIIDISLVERGHHTIASELVFKMAMWKKAVLGKMAKGEPREIFQIAHFLGEFPKAKKIGNTGRIIA